MTASANTDRGATEKPRDSKQSEDGKSVSIVSQPTFVKVRRFRWWLPYFVYQAVINDISTIYTNQRKPKMSTARTPHPTNNSQPDNTVEILDRKIGELNG